MLKTPVSVLEELMVKERLAAPNYQFHSTGPPHQMSFTCQVKAGDKTATGEGTTKKDSKHDGAKKMLSLFGVKMDSQSQESSDLSESDTDNVDTEIEDTQVSQSQDNSPSAFKIKAVVSAPISTKAAINELCQKEPEKSPSSVHKALKLSKNPQSNKARKRKSGQQDKAYALMKDLPNKKQSRDKFDIFGEHVAFKIRGLRTEQAQDTVEHLICNILFEAGMGKYDQSPAQLTHSPAPANACTSQGSSSHTSVTLVPTIEPPITSPQSVGVSSHSSESVASPPVPNVSNEDNESPPVPNVSNEDNENSVLEKTME